MSDSGDNKEPLESSSGHTCMELSVRNGTSFILRSGVNHRARLDQLGYPFCKGNEDSCHQGDAKGVKLSKTTINGYSQGPLRKELRREISPCGSAAEDFRNGTNGNYE